MVDYKNDDGTYATCTAANFVTKCPTVATKEDILRVDKARVAFYKGTR